MDCRVVYFEPTNNILEVRYGNYFLAAIINRNNHTLPWIIILINYNDQHALYSSYISTPIPIHIHMYLVIFLHYT